MPDMFIWILIMNWLEQGWWLRVWEVLWKHLYFIIIVIVLIIISSTLVIANNCILYLYYYHMQSNIGVDASKLLPIRAGEVHFCRIPVQYWQHRILMIKALGLNALSVYILWNYHEKSKGNFDYTTDNKNLPLFLQLAEKHNMMVLFRPGPYVCAEWDFGGLPARLLNIEGIQIRANNKIFLQETKVYFESLVPIIKKHQRTDQNQKGCIVMLQIENQYGFYGTDKSYMQQIRKMWKDLDIYLTEYYVDWIQNIQKCHWEGANIGINDFSKQQQEDTVRKFEKSGFLLGGEIYSGWMTHWTEKWGGKRTKKVLKDYQFLMGKKHSFAMYMVHGGTNFGLTAGANGLKGKASDYWGAITSYDYDAPINQQGSATPKYHAIRQLFKSFLGQLPQIPPPIHMIEIPEIKVHPKGSLFDNIPQFSVSTHEKPFVFESSQLQMYHQGVVLYATQLEADKQYDLKVVVHDYAVVYIGHKAIQVLDRTKQKSHEVKITKQMLEQNGNKLKFVVQASGHINFDKNMLTDHKGLYSIEGFEKQQKWTMWKFPIQDQLFSSWKSVPAEEANVWGHTSPKVYQGTFSVQKVGDTYLDVSEYGKGYVWINGHNLGRYWHVGPQKRLFCPGAWMKKGDNRILIFNIDGNAGGIIRGVKELYHTPIIYSDEE